MRLKEIEKRLREIEVEMNAPDADLDALTEETRNLLAEKEDILAKAAQRQALLDSIARGRNGIGDEAIPGLNNEPTVEERTFSVANEEYRTGWLKQIRGLELNEVEQRAVITTAAASAGSAVPTSTLNKIIEKVEQLAPMLSKIELLRVPGGVTVPIEGTTAAAAIHTQGASITASGDTITNITLGAFEVTKLITISKSVEKMTVDAFEAWLVKKLAKAIADKINALIINGTGSSQPAGINSITWAATNSVTVTASGSLTEANILKVVGLLNGGYDAGAEWLMTKQTFFTDFYPLMDSTKNVTIALIGNQWYVAGYPVTFDDNVTAHEAFLGNIEMGYIGNMPEEVTVTGQFVTRENSYDFLGCAMFDGKIKDAAAFVKIAKATS